jgi:hypothetical protein
MVAMRDSSGTALAVGRLTGWEPLGFEAGDNNWYRFVANGPTGKTDPSGLQGVDGGGWIPLFPNDGPILFPEGFPTGPYFTPLSPNGSGLPNFCPSAPTKTEIQIFRRAFDAAMRNEMQDPAVFQNMFTQFKDAHRANPGMSAGQAAAVLQTITTNELGRRAEAKVKELAGLGNGDAPTTCPVPRRRPAFDLSFKFTPPSKWADLQDVFERSLRENRAPSLEELRGLNIGLEIRH